MKVYLFLACLMSVGCVSSQYDYRELSLNDMEVLRYKKVLGSNYRSEVGYMIRSGYGVIRSKYCHDPRHWIWMHRSQEEDIDLLCRSINYFECHTNSPAYKGHFTVDCVGCNTNAPKYQWEGSKVYVMEGSNKVYKTKPKSIWW